MYFDVCDGIFLNYKWNEEFLKSTAELAGNTTKVHIFFFVLSPLSHPFLHILTPLTGDRRDSVFVGIDIFGRGTYGGGGFSTHVAVELISK